MQRGVVLSSRKGIVIKQFSNSYKVALLDAQLGRVDGVVRKELPVGALIHYHVDRQKENLLFLTAPSITFLPFTLARDDLLFWHHVLEICYYFVPVGAPLCPLFMLLEFLYSVDSSIEWTVHAKKLYLLKMLITIGWNVELAFEHQKIIQTLVTVSERSMFEYTLKKEHEKVVDEWLSKCIVEHPAMDKFNTIQFLITNRRS